MGPTCLLFAYGLLKSAYQPPKTSRRHWPDRIRGRLFDLGPYPGAIDVGTAEGWFEGEVIELESAELGALDRFEGVENGEYRRLRATTESGQAVWVYEYCRQVPPEATALVRWEKPTGPEQGTIAQEIWRRSQKVGYQPDSG